MTDILLAAVGFVVFIVFLGFALWFGAALFLMVAITTVAMILYLKFRIYYLRWKDKGVFKATDINQAPIRNMNNNNNASPGDSTIIDVEYQEIPAKK